jgi:cytidine deaminase
MLPDLTLVPYPELVIGLVAPIGVDLDLVSDKLQMALRQVDYNSTIFRITSLMGDLEFGKVKPSNSYVSSYRARIEAANSVRERLGDDALAALAITAIRAQRAKVNEADNSSPDLNLDRALQKHAYIVRQLKRPDEVTLLRRVYGRNFLLISAFAPPTARKNVISAAERRSRHNQISQMDADNEANSLVNQDAREATDKHGQNVRDAFPLADVVVDASSKDLCEIQINRFVKLLFGNNFISPTRDEYGMYIAKSASLRSLDLSRQVGAAIFSQEGQVVCLGANEVPSAHGGSYWPDDEGDARDYVRGYDPSDQRQFEILVDLIGRLQNGNHLSDAFGSQPDPGNIARALLSATGQKPISEAMVMDLLEFGRIIHAEMSAITDAARKGLPINNSTLYCTTFPCHMCAKHIVAAGIKRVVYIEPYSKSYASDLHHDSISIDEYKPDKVLFDTFIGISPFRYRDLFERRTKRKDSQNKAIEWIGGRIRPNIETFEASYQNSEQRVAAIFHEKVDNALRNSNKDYL